MPQNKNDRFKPFASQVKADLGSERVITLMRSRRLMQKFTQLSAWLIRQAGDPAMVTAAQIRVAYDVAIDHDAADHNG